MIKDKLRMKVNVRLNDIMIRSDIRPGDSEYIIRLHGKLYKEEYNYGEEFENYVAAGLKEFYENYDPACDRVWICEHGGKTIGFLLLIHRENNSAQLRYFLIVPEYRGIGLGRKLIELYMDFFNQCGYTSSYLWTIHELSAAASLYQQFGFKLTEEIISSSFGKPVREQRYDLVK